MIKTKSIFLIVLILITITSLTIVVFVLNRREVNRDAANDNIIEVSSYSEGVDKYTPRQRFGVGFDGHQCKDWIGRVDDFNWQDLGIGWYFDWTSNSGPRTNLEYMGLVGGWQSVEASQTACDSLKTTIQNNRSKYPDGMMWTVGNEIGWDDGRTVAKYVQDFKSWNTCLKSINPTFKVGTGAIISPYHQLPRLNGKPGCIEKSLSDENSWVTDPNSGGNYFKSILQGLKANSYDMPDFIVNHAYHHCQQGGWTSINFIKNIRIYRNIMKAEGVENLDLIIKEFSAGGSWSTEYKAEYEDYLEETIAYIMETKDIELGNPTDNYRMVQKFAWFAGNDWKNYKKASGGWACDNPNVAPIAQFEHDALFNTYTTEIKPLGTRFKIIAARYGANITPYTQTFKGVETVPLYNMSKLRNNPRTNWDINHLLASNDCGNLISKGYKAFGLDGTPNKPIGFIISPNATQQEVSSLGSLITPLYRGIFAEDPQNHIHYFESTEAPKKDRYESSALFEKLLGYVFTYDVSVDFLTPARELCRYEFLPELTVGSGINNDLVHLCSEANRLSKATMSGIKFQKNSRGLINGDRVGSIQLRERPLYVLDFGARSQKTECNTTF